MEAYRGRTRHAPRLDPEGRNLRHTYVLPDAESKTWRVQQMLVDPEERNDWVVEYEVDLEASRESGQPVLDLLRLGVFAVLISPPVRAGTSVISCRTICKIRLEYHSMPYIIKISIQETLA